MMRPPARITRRVVVMPVGVAATLRVGFVKIWIATEQEVRRYLAVHAKLVIVGRCAPLAHSSSTLGRDKARASLSNSSRGIPRQASTHRRATSAVEGSMYCAWESSFSPRSLIRPPRSTRQSDEQTSPDQAQPNHAPPPP